MSFSSLPVIDLNDDESMIIKLLFDACSTTGFFYLRNHGLLQQQQKMFTLSKEYFRLPADVKEKYIIGENNQGFVRRGQENLDSSKSKQFDDKECFNIRKSLMSELPEFFQQPDRLQLITDFQNNCHSLLLKLLTYLARSFSIDENYFTSRHNSNLPSGETLRLLYYPAIENQPEESIRAGAHSDYGSLTLLFQHDHKSGLQVLDRASNLWHPVEPFDDMIVVNFGDALEYWSNGFIKSTVHRVIMPKIDPTRNNERFSIAFFCHPNDDALLTPIPTEFILNHQFDKDAHAKHALDHETTGPITAGEHLRVRLSKTYAY